MYGKTQKKKKKVKRQRKSGKVFAEHMTGKKVIYLIYKELLHIQENRTTQQKIKQKARTFTNVSVQ